MFNVTLQGASEFVERLEQMPAVVQALLRSKVEALAIQLQAHVIRDKLSGQVLGVKTDALRRSIQEVVEASDDSVIGKVFSAGDVKYAAIHEYGGTIPAHDIYPSKAQALAFVVGGKTVFAKHVHIPDVKMPERSFLRSALADMAPEISSEMKAAVIQGIQQTVRGA
jgi:phage gpG-like protein